MEQPSDNYLGWAVAAFREVSRQFSGDFEAAFAAIAPFLRRFYPVLRHYRPECVGQCLALSYDQLQLGRTSQQHGFGLQIQQHGFGLQMGAGDHPQDRVNVLGSFRDDGSYLAILAFDYFEGRLR